MTMLIRKPRVAFQGERGAFSEEAAMKLLGDEIELVPRKTFVDLFKSLDSGVADYLLAPVENGIAGAVQPSVDLMRSNSLAVVDEVEINIEQLLIGCPGASFETIETVQSHPIALAQCTRFLETNPQLKSVIADDTAGSVAEIVRLNDPKRAAIGGQRAAVLYGASIIRRSIQDRTENYTRFVLLSANGTAHVSAAPTHSALVKELAS